MYRMMKMMQFSLAKKLATKMSCQIALTGVLVVGRQGPEKIASSVYKGSA